MLNDLDGMTQSPSLELVNDFLKRLEMWDKEQFSRAGRGQRHQIEESWGILVGQEMALGPDLFAEVLNAIWAAIKMTVTALEGYAALHRRHLGSGCVAAVTSAVVGLACRPFIDEDTYDFLLYAVQWADEGIGV